MVSDSFSICYARHERGDQGERGISNELALPDGVRDLRSVAEGSEGLENRRYASCYVTSYDVR